MSNLKDHILSPRLFLLSYRMFVPRAIIFQLLKISANSEYKLLTNADHFQKSCRRILHKRSSDTNKFSIHGTILIMLFCFFVRSLPWIPQILAPHIYLPHSANLAVSNIKEIITKFLSKLSKK